MAKTEKKSFVVYHDIRQPLEFLSDAQCGKLFRAALEYSEYGKIPELNDATLSVAFSFLKSSIDRDAASWERKSHARAEAGKKGMENRWREKQDNKR